ncbi:MAG: homoserine O-acetyltransferase [Desulforhopalus sp.]|nr:homoserine O-acetyltransferase [Desulforhopalus sp.]
MNRLIVEKEFFTFAEDEPMQLDSGLTLSPVTIAWERIGELNEAGDNAILITHAFSGDSHVTGYYTTDEKDEKPGWWDYLIGPGRAIDTNKYCVICPNILGSCMGSTGPASIDSARKKPWALDFPMLTIGDMVKAQKALVDHLGITRLRAVIGGSVGGMQVLEWCVRYPAMVDAAVPIATTMRHSALAIAFNEIARQAIMADPHWNNGSYYDGEHPSMGLAIARMVGHVTYLSDEAMRRKFGRRLQNKKEFSFGFDADFQIESYLRHQGTKFVNRFDANSLLYITRAADYFNAAERLAACGPLTGGPEAAIKYLVISYSTDWLYPTYQSRELVHTLKRSSQNVSFVEIESDCGHDAFLIPEPTLPELMRGFLAGVKP